MTLALGQPDIFPERPAFLYGWKPVIDDTDWLVKAVSHDISDGGGYTNSIEFEVRDDPTTDKHRSNFRRNG